MPGRAKLLIRYAANYEEMFSGLYKAVQQQATELNPDNPAEAAAENQRSVAHIKAAVIQNIQWAKQTFKANNAWVTWWMRWLRLVLEQQYSLPSAQKSIAQAIAKEPSSNEQDIPSSLRELEGYWPNFVHLMATPAPELAAYRPGFKTIPTVLTEMGTIEREWQESRDSILTPQEGDKIIIKFPDGWAWWLLDRHRCNEESRAMGHCGNGGSNDTSQRILSLRQPKGKNEWEPHLTFILEGNGFLGEMKGKNNDKPVQRYHKYIIALLENDIVKGIQGGGYLPEHNFAITDLTQEEQDALYEKKPALMPIGVYYKKFGADETFVEKMRTHFKESDNMDIGWLPQVQKFQVEEFKNLEDLIDEVGNSGAEWCYNVLSGNEYLDGNSGMSKEEAAKSMLEDLPNEEVEKIGRTLAAEYADSLPEWLEETGHDPEEDEFDPTSESDIISLAQFANDEVFEALDRAYETGYQYGTDAEIHKHLKKAIESSPFVQVDDNMWDSPYYYALDIPTLLEIIDKNETLDDYLRYQRDEGEREIKVSEPYNGYSDFDKKGAIESFHEEYDVEKKFREALGEEGVAQYEKEKAEQKQYMEERSRLMSEIRSKFKDASPQVRSELQDADWDFRHGDYAPLVKMVRGVIPGAFPFAPEEEPVAA